METKKLSQEELNKFTELTDQEKFLINNLGLIEFRITLLNFQKKELDNEIYALQNKQHEFGKQLQDKYGMGNIDLEKGEFIPLNE